MLLASAECAGPSAGIANAAGSGRGHTTVGCATAAPAAGVVAGSDIVVVCDTVEVCGAVAVEAAAPLVVQVAAESLWPNAATAFPQTFRGAAIGIATLFDDSTPPRIRPTDSTEAEAGAGACAASAPVAVLEAAVLDVAVLEDAVEPDPLSAEQVEPDVESACPATATALPQRLTGMSSGASTEFDDRRPPVRMGAVTAVVAEPVL